MRARFIRLGVLALAICLFATPRAFAQPVINFDENGNGTFVGAGPIPATIGTDPSNGKNTLVYTLPFVPSVFGDVNVSEVAAGGPLSDVLRFFPGSNQLFVYSDTAESGELPDLADVGLPGNVITPTASRIESGVEGGLQGLFPYTPTPNEPGFLAGAAGAQYNFTSDTAVPEPASIMGIAALATGMAIRRRPRRG
jgi:hypothetical protein